MDASTYVGGLIGQASSYTVVRNVQLDVLVNNNTSGWGTYVGGVAGVFENSIASRLDVKATLNGYRYIGGLFGRMSDSSLDIAQVEINLTGNEYVSGIAYEIHNSEISNIYVYGLIDCVNSWASGSIAGYITDWAVSFVITEVDYTQHTGGSYVRQITRTDISYGYLVNTYYEEHLRAIEHNEDSTIEEIFSLYPYDNAYETFGQSVSWMQDQLAPYFDPTIWDFDTLDTMWNPTLLM